jgi:hypothetical protein
VCGVVYKTCLLVQYTSVGSVHAGLKDVLALGRKK